MNPFLFGRFGLRDLVREFLPRRIPMLFKKDYQHAVAIVKDVQKANKTAAIIVEQAFVDFFSETDGKFDAEKFHEACKKVKP